MDRYKRNYPEIETKQYDRNKNYSHSYHNSVGNRSNSSKLHPSQSRDYNAIPRHTEVPKNSRNYQTFEQKRLQIHDGGRSFKEKRSDSYNKDYLNRKSSVKKVLENAESYSQISRKKEELQRFAVYKSMERYDVGTQVGEGTYG
jgi:hypothetical protein